MNKDKMNPLTFEEMETAFNKHVKWGQCNFNGTCDTELLRDVAKELHMIPMLLARHEDFRFLVINRWNEE